MTTEEGVVTTDKTADELVGRVFEATVMRADTMARLGRQAGFRDVERLDAPESETLRFYRMTP